MDPNSGRIYQQQLGPGEQPETEAEIEARGQIPLTKEQARELLKRVPSARPVTHRQLVGNQAALTTHPAARALGESDDDARKARNARKRERRSRQ